MALGQTAEIKITGHAMAGSFGHDIVCAAVSTLYAQLANYLSHPTVNDIEGVVTIKSGYLDAGDQRLLNAFEGTVEQLSVEYPDNVVIEHG